MSAEEIGIEAGDVRLPFVYDGIVVDTNDPKGIGRVRVNIPGVAEPTPWALPMGTHGGTNRRGIFCVPPVDSVVGVWFNQGDPQAPRYIGGYWGSAVPGASDDGTDGPEVPERVRSADVSERAQIATWESERWAIILDDREFDPNDENPVGQDTLLILHKATGQFIELDGGAQGITISGTTISIKATGALVLDGLVVTIAGRKVRKNAGVIS